MATYGLLIDYEYCTNCGSCQVSCKEEHGYPVGKTGIAVHADGPWYIDDDNINFNYFPLPTDLCDLCKDRTARGREPICVHHCLANILYYGTVEELSKKLEEKPKQMLIVPQFMPREAKGGERDRCAQGSGHGGHRHWCLDLRCPPRRRQGRRVRGGRRLGRIPIRDIFTVSTGASRMVGSPPWGRWKTNAAGPVLSHWLGRGMHGRDRIRREPHGYAGLHPL